MDQPAYPASRDPAFNLTGGPAGATPATLAALGRPVLHHLDPAFGALCQRTAELLQQAFGTRESPVILPGEAVVGLEAAAASLIGPEDIVLNLVSGIYGRGYGAWARRYAREVVEIEVPTTAPCRPRPSPTPCASGPTSRWSAWCTARRPPVPSTTSTRSRRWRPSTTRSGGQGDLARIVLQIGHMGTGAFPLGPVIAVTALGRALRSLGARADIGAAVEAAVSALDA